MIIVINSISSLNIQKRVKVTLKHLLLTFWLLPLHAFLFTLCATYYFKQVTMHVFLLWIYFRAFLPAFSLSTLFAVPEDISVKYPCMHTFLHQQTQWLPSFGFLCVSPFGASLTVLVLSVNSCVFVWGRELNLGPSVWKPSTSPLSSACRRMC